MTLIDPLNPKAQLGSVIDEGRIKLMSILERTGLTDHQLSLQLREASQLQTLADHPNIVKLYKTIQTRDCLFLVLERCRTDLFDAIMRHDGFAEPTARRLFAQLADAVAMSHSETVRYMAPECLAGDAEWRRNAPAHIIKSLAAPVAYSPPANDVWSLGIILINLLTGKNPGLNLLQRTSTIKPTFFSGSFGFSVKYINRDYSPIHY
ncbi:hypothetical protein BSLG_005681 [Batrachochytrium salamandrivorans]|nr:hypothetical protein BSLG_005681 [Batrachochytrium salamandrivorans]